MVPVMDYRKGQGLQTATSHVSHIGMGELAAGWENEDTKPKRRVAVAGSPP